ncbi:hypothetical protein [Mycobacterium sp. SMC-4]|uniref:hypothetical protein n=1 Tax=Mycobacterium sp. SMC-4 TaxID=2857059 RepID=UPI0021B3E01C|nr:hypothetical protein [Mycobacterium sp. SMC-4]UXA17106.1 hypothetical protein KXD98_20510 [Mycobacterium sp. SMC-4]
MTATVDPRPATGFGNAWRIRWTPILALLASVVTMLVVTSAALAPTAYWVLSSVALTAALAALVVGETTWESAVDRARAAGIVAH